jgi:futalosine hydrolase
LVTGVGMVATAAHVAHALARQRYDMALNFGLCGSFDPALPPGTVVHVTSDELSELGVEDGERFISMQALGLVDGTLIENAAPPKNRVLEQLPAVRGITVSTVHGHQPTIAAVVARLDPQVESMEGAAFAYACRLNDVPYAQVRAVSNVVERRNREAWRIELAIDNLNEAALRILDHL